MAQMPDPAAVLQRAVLEALPGRIREETWRRASVTSGRTEVTDAVVSILPGELVLVSTEVIETLLTLCGFAKLATDPECTDDEVAP